MPAERIIAVDFGTSTSVMRVKRYLDGRPVGDRLECKPVTFSMGSTMVPTLVQKRQDTGESVYFGHGAEIPHKKTETFRNFKVDIENPDTEIRERARNLTTEFFGFLAKTYRTQSEGGHLGESDDRERTIISYPVKWSEETKAFMVKTARDAGFPNVEGLDEAQAAIQAVIAQNTGYLEDKGFFRKNTPANILLIDMGAGTTDLVLCCYTPGDQPQMEVLATWPKENGSLFGGQEMDDLLKELICSSIPKDGVDIVSKKMGLDKFKAWKETVVSPALARGESVDYFSALDDLLTLLEIDADYLIDRDTLESFATDYLRQLPKLINGCLGEAGMAGDCVDLAILTGGHSQWYFAREILSGKLEQFGCMGLSRIEAEPDRIVSIRLPQETVALGLVYGRILRDSCLELTKDKTIRADETTSCLSESVSKEKRDRNQQIVTGRMEIKDVFHISGRGSVATGRIYGANLIPEQIIGKEVDIMDRLSGMKMDGKYCVAGVHTLPDQSAGMLISGISIQALKRASYICYSYEVLSNGTVPTPDVDVLVPTPEADQNVMNDFLDDVKLELMEIEKHICQVKHEGKLSFSSFKTNVGIYRGKIGQFEGVPYEDVLYVRQDWLFPKYGFAISKRGFHSCGSGFFDVSVFVEWKEFLSCNRIEPGKNAGFICGIHESEWKTAKYQLGFETPRNGESAVPLFTHLLSSLQKKYTVDAHMEIVKK